MNPWIKFIPGSRALFLSLGTFFFLYIAQSVPMSFFSTALQVLMREANFSLTLIATLQIIKMPWVLKFLWSPYVDRCCTTTVGFKRFIILSEMAYAAMILVVAFFSVAHDFFIVLTLVFFSLIASATQDIATDALAALSFDRKDQRLLNSVQSMGSFGGTLIGSGVLLLALHHWGWNVVVPCLSVFALIALLPLVWHRKLTIRPKEKSRKVNFGDILSFFRQPGIGKQVGFIMLYASGLIAILAMLRPYMVDLHYNMKEIGMLSGILGTATAFVTSFLIGILLRKFGIGRMRLYVAILILITALFFLALSYTHATLPLLIVGVCLLWSSYGSATVIVYTAAMDCVREGREGTDFTLQTVLYHLSGIIFAIIAGHLADFLGYASLFAFVVVIALLSLGYIISKFKIHTDDALSFRDS